MDDAAARTKVEWREWGEAAFAEAAERERPVLLASTGFWCGWCRAMDGRTYDDPRIAANLNEEVVPIRVDADERPRVRARYTMGGLPATVFTTPDGRLIASAGYLDTDDFRDVFDRVLASWERKGSEAGQVPDPLADPEIPGGTATADVERQLIGQLDAQFDDEHAGWGSETKFPLPETVQFALPRRPEQATRTLQAIIEHLEDPGDGGFFRHAQNPDWGRPMLEKLLSVNAGLLGALADAYLVTGEQAYRDAADRTVAFLQDHLWTGERFANSQAPGEYFSQDPAERDPNDEPPVDTRAYADSTAETVTALLRYTACTDDDRARRLAEHGLDWLEEQALSDGTVAHAPHLDATSVLADQAAVLEALTTATQVLDSRYATDARAIADRTIDALQTDAGAFMDGLPEGPALLDRPLHPIDENARLADSLVDLALLTGEDRYREAAREAVDAFADAADHLGVQAARYARATARVLDRPLVIDVGTAPGSDLHRAALRMADPEKVVVPDAEFDGNGRARIRGEPPQGDPIDSPADLAAAVQRVLDRTGANDSTE